MMYKKHPGLIFQTCIRSLFCGELFQITWRSSLAH